MRRVPKREEELLALALSETQPTELPPYDRRSGRDRRSGKNRRLASRPASPDRRSGGERRRSERRQLTTLLPPRPDDPEARQRTRELLRRLTHRSQSAQ